MGGLGGIDRQLKGLVGCNRARQRAWALGRPRSWKASVAASLCCRKSEKCAYAGKLACGGRGAQSLASPARQECAQVRRGNVEKVCRANFVAAMATEKVDQSMRGRIVGADCMGRSAAVVLKMAGPARRRDFGRMVGQRF